MRSGSLSLGFLLVFGGACSQIIGLGDYENADGRAGSGGASGGVSAKGGSGVGAEGGRGGSGFGGQVATGGSSQSGGDGSGGGVPGSSGSGPDGGVGAHFGEAGGGAGGAGGLDTAGTSSGGTSTAGADTGGKAGNGGTIGGTGGKSGTGGTTGGAGGKGGSGGITGGAGGKGGASCSTHDLLLDNNPNFDDSDAAPPDPAPWVDYTSSSLAIVNRQMYLSNRGITAHTGGNAVWLGGEGTHYTFEDTKGGAGEIYALDLDLTIPVGTTQVTLSCYYQTQTLETSATIPASRDIMVAWLWDYALDDSAYVFQRLFPSNSSAGWHLFTNTAGGAAAGELAGRKLSLEFYAEVDDLRRSDFFIDTCSLVVTTCN